MELVYCGLNIVAVYRLQTSRSKLSDTEGVGIDWRGCSHAMYVRVYVLVCIAGYHVVGTQ